jgi:hypothetical protein
VTAAIAFTAMGHARGRFKTSRNLPSTMAMTPLTRTIAVLAAATLLTLARAGTASDFELRAGSVTVAVALDDRLTADEDGEPWRTWVESGLAAATAVTGSFPRDRVIVDIDPASAADDPVAFGRVRRSRPPRLQFWVARDPAPASLARDWRVYHEFVHLLIPFPGNRDIWFTEGLASYYQHLVQARIGVIPQARAWRELLDGFRRGREDPAGRGRTLRALSPDMWRERAYRRVYWTGAAFFLRVDVRLRTESGGRHSLDSALAAFHRCCLDEDRDWRARDLVEALGRVSIAEIWRQEYFRTIDREAAPRTGDALERLGIAADSAAIRFDPRRSARALRAAIAGPRNGGLQSVAP